MTQLLLEHSVEEPERPAKRPRREFLQMFHGDHHWPLIAINKATKHLVAKSFPSGANQAVDAHAWAAEHNSDGYDLYFAINPISRPLNTKPSKADVREAVCLWTDCDPSSDLAGDALEAWQDGKLAELQAGKDGVPAPTMIIDSGRGLWAYWWLQTAAPVDGKGPLTAAVEGALRGLLTVFDGDPNCAEISRIARLPGFVNHKTGLKARVVAHDAGRRYALADFPTSPRSHSTRNEAAEKGTESHIDLIDDEAAIAAVRAYLGVAPAAIEGQHGRKTTMTVLQRCQDLGCGFDTSIDLMMEIWNDRCEPPWGFDEIAYALRGLERNDPIGCDHPAVLAEERAKLAALFFEPLPAMPGEASPEEVSKISATPFSWREPATIRERQWIYGRHYVRQFVSTTIAPGGVGKSSLAIVEALAIVTGRPLLNIVTDETGAVWYWNGEDPADELQRRVTSAMLHYNIRPDEVAGRLFIDSGRKTGIVIATQDRSGIKIVAPVVEQVIATIRENGIALLIIDPFVSSHQVVENDNPAIDRVTKTWARIADVTGCAVELVHHSRKTGGGEITVEDGRGAVALLSTARSARTLNPMTKEEGKRASIERRHDYFRIDAGKANLAPLPETATWVRKIGVPLKNGTDGSEGDWVAVVVPWNWPDPLEGIVTDHLDLVKAKIQAGRWRKDVQAKDWVGKAVADALGLDVNSKADKARIVSLLKSWISSSLLEVVDELSEKRELKSFVRVVQNTGEAT